MGLWEKIFGGKKPGDKESGGKPESGAEGAPEKSASKSDGAVQSEYSGVTLRKYEYHYGGNMNGNSHRETVEPVDDAYARVSISHAEWYAQDPKVEEYLVDIGILGALGEVFCRYGMEKWHRKEFTDEFVCDGETYGYDFEFDGKPEVWFSSMVFPREYGDKLHELREVFRRYVAEGRRLPGLVLPPCEVEDEFCRKDPEKGKITLSVYEYSRGNLNYRLGNGTDETIEWAADAALYRIGESEPIAESSGKYPNHAGAHRFDECILEVPGQLAEGKYRLEAGGVRCEVGISSDF